MNKSKYINEKMKQERHIDIERRKEYRRKREELKTLNRAWIHGEFELRKPKEAEDGRDSEGQH